MNTRLLLLPLLASAFAAPASAAEQLRDLCTDRPGLGTPPCIVDRNRVVAEIGIADWTLSRDSGGRTDTFTLGNLNLRYGLTGSLEVQLGWNGFAFQRSRDSSGAISRRSGGGDARIALRQSLSHPDGDGFSLALMPYVSLPTGRVPFGSGGWGAGMLVPVSYSLPQGLHADFTGEVDAAPNQGGGGRHLAYSGVAGLDVDLSKPLTATFEVAAKRDEDPSGASTQWLGSASLAWRRGRNLQFDAGAVAGLNGAAPDLELYVGVSRRF